MSVSEPHSRYYRTENGSEVEISELGGTFIIFNWLQEGACPEAVPSTNMSASAGPLLFWECHCDCQDCLGDGWVKLIRRDDV